MNSPNEVVLTVWFKLRLFLVFQFKYCNINNNINNIIPPMKNPYKNLKKESVFIVYLVSTSYVTVSGKNLDNVTCMYIHINNCYIYAHVYINIYVYKYRHIYLFSYIYIGFLLRTLRWMERIWTMWPNGG
jgi:hypothetical protein